MRLIYTIHIKMLNYVMLNELSIHPTIVHTLSQPVFSALFSFVFNRGRCRICAAQRQQSLVLSSKRLSTVCKQVIFAAKSSSALS